MDTKQETKTISTGGPSKQDSRMVKQTFYVNSHHSWRNSGTDSNFIYELDIPDNMQYDHVVVLSANIPKSWYNVPTGQNTFTLTENGFAIQVALSVGNYTRLQLKNQLILKLNAATTHGWVYSVSYPASSTEPETGKLTFTVAGLGVNDHQPTFGFNATSMYDQMGFESDTNYTFSAGTLVSPNIIKLQQEDTIFLYSDMVSGGSENILQEFFLGSDQPFSTKEYICPDIHAHSRPIVKRNSKQYSFTLTDENGVVLDLNGKNFVMTILLFRDVEVKNGKGSFGN